MRAPLSWIRDFTPIDRGVAVDDLVAALNQVGLEVEGVEEPGREVGGVVVARIIEVTGHPGADRLTLVDVDTGDGHTRVVCGATNVAAGDVVPYAPAGARLPEPIGVLKRRTIRGVESDGMLCSPAELGLGDDEEGILHLDAQAEPGDDVSALLELEDVIFDLSITPNRPDAMCIVGVARELAAHFGLPLDAPRVDAATDPAVDSEVSVHVEAPDRCPRYLARVAAVAVGPSPAWMARRLAKAGMRPISNVVDVTNYVLLERNQPLHAFDLRRLPGRGIRVRLAEAGEQITTLDGVARELSGTDLLICDAHGGAQAIAGIMGGGSSEVSDDTTELLLEAAYFEPMGIARSSKRLKLRSESSARFERGIDPDGVADHAERAMALLVDVAAARVAGQAVDHYPDPVERARIRVRTAKVNAVLGTSLPDTAIVDALRPLGLEVERSADDITVVAPTFRPDLTREIDVIEEVARRVGFASIGRTVAKPEGQVGALSRRQRDRRTVADALVGAGLSEAVTIPLVSPRDLERAGAPTEGLVEAANPLRAEESVLRTRILPGLLRAVARNHGRGFADVALFEIGRVFLAPQPGQLLPDEPTHLAVALAGEIARRPVEDDRPVDARDLVDVLGHVAGALELADVRLASADRAGFASGRAAAVLVDGVDAGMLGETHPDVVETLELVAPVVAMELDLDRLLDGTRRDRSFRAPSPYPPASIDLAFIVDVVVASGDVAATLRDAGGDVLEEVRLFDVFRAAPVGEDRKSLTFRLRFRAADRTLTDAEVGRLRQACIGAVVSAHGAELRG